MNTDPKLGKLRTSLQSTNQVKATPSVLLRSPERKAMRPERSERNMKNVLRVLMVEDSKADADLVLETLRNCGHEVDYTVVDTQAAMRAALERQDWDLITSDHAMPHFNASEALELAKELRPDLPFIIVSGEIDLNLAVALMRSGAKDYIQKRELPRLVPRIERELREVERRREKKTAKDALEFSETRYRRLFETAQDGILILDADTGQILDVNPFLVKMLGYSREEFLEKKLWEIGTFQDKRESKINFEELQREGYVRYEDLPLETKAGQQASVEFVSNVYLVNKTRVIQCNVRDITQRKQAEAEARMQNAELEQRVRERSAQLESLDKELQAFNCAVSHDLRAPIRQILGFVGFFRLEHAGDLSGKATQVIERIRASAERMNALIIALLNLARFSRREIKRQLVPMSTIAHLVAAELQQSDPARKVEFVIAEGITAYGDEQLLYIVLENLLANAWKFTAHRDCSHIEFGSGFQADGNQNYFVRDNGVGFDMAHAEKLFGAFQHLHGEKEFPGIGIGLATVQRIIHRHGGQVWAQAVEDQGAAFHFSIALDRGLTKLQLAREGIHG
jgi:PAS domain S-box-containing protein